jgi:hypothetical protein
VGVSLPRTTCVQPAGKRRTALSHGATDEIATLGLFRVHSWAVARNA